MSNTPKLAEHQLEQDLPNYATVRGQQAGGSSTGAMRGEQHKFLETAKGKKWLSIFVKSRAIQAVSLPVFFSGDTISGRVELDLDKPEASKEVSIAVYGGTTFVGQDEEIFLKQEQNLWTPSGSEKLTGKHSWPFTFNLPPDVTVKDFEKDGKYPLPPSLTERASPAYIDYKLVVTIKRGFLKVNQTLVTNFGFQTLTTPGSPSTLRRLAYSELSPLIGPEGDPEGWKILPEVKVEGILFNVKQVEVDCTLAIATPLSYALGSAIPLMITISGQDTHALDVLATPNAVQLRLRKYMATGVEATDEQGQRRTDNCFVELCGSAYFWPSRKGAEEPNKRVLQGELEIAKTLRPSFKFPKVTIRYLLELMPFAPPGFVAAERNNPVLLTEQIALTSRQIPGLVTHSYAPPGYEKPQSTDYNKSVGLLENGNQRFLGHHHGH